MLRHIELRMESLTQELEALDQEKVEVARITCEVERRQREKEARMEKQRNMEASRSQWNREEISENRTVDISGTRQL